MCLHLACSQTLYFLFKVRRARVMKNKPRGIYSPPAQRGASLSHTPMFSKRAKRKNETTSVYRLTFSTFTHTPGFYLGYLRRRSFPPPKKNAQPPPPPPKKIFLSSQSISNYIGKKSRRDQASTHAVTFLKTVVQDEPNCISGSMHIHLKKFPGGKCPRIPLGNS